MFNEVRNLFKRTWAELQSELHRREPEDEVAELLSRMRQELTAARAALPEYSATVERLRLAAQRERASLTECERRGQLAAKIGDAETARVAEQFAVRHRERIEVLEQRVQSASAEHRLRAREAEEMLLCYRQADAQRFAMVAQLRSRRAQASMSGATNAFDEFARMEDTVQDQAGYADALAELDANLSPGASPPPAMPDPAADVERRLAELKRQMGR